MSARLARRRFLAWWTAGVYGAVPVHAAVAGTAARCRELIALSRTLVATAQSGRGAATRFRIDVVHYRESLRELMQEDARQPPAARLQQALLMDMVRMVALLQAAAECQTGRYIVCPADLIDRLNRQQLRVDEAAARSLGAGS